MSKKISYANTVRRSTKLKIEEISIKKWLKHYGLEEYYHTIFVEKHIVYTWMAPPKDKHPYEHSDLLTSIKTNVDLLFSFTDSLKFKEAISVPIERKLMEMVSDGIIDQDQFHEIGQGGKIYLQFYNAFELLLSQKLEYKSMLSVFGDNPSKEKYESKLEEYLTFLNNKKYISKNIFKDELIKKLKLISVDDLVHCKQTTLNLLLSLPIEDIKKYILYNTNKVVKITNGLKSTMDKKQFNIFIDQNESLKVFESCYNNYDLNYVRKSLKSNFDAKSLLSTHRMDLLEFIFNPSNLLDSKITDEIYAILFPDNDHIYIEEQVSKIDTFIPKTLLSDTFMKRNKMRIFYIQGHGTTCTIEDYEKRDRLDFEKVFTKIHNRQASKTIYPTKYNAYMFKIITTQPVGRLTYFIFFELFSKIFSSKHRNTFLQGLINSNKIEHLRLLENIFTMYFNHYCIKTKQILQSSEKSSQYFKKSRLKHVKPTDHLIKYIDTDLTTSDVVNFVKYGYKYKPINTKFTFKTFKEDEGIIGIFELNDTNSNDLIKLNNKITATLTKDEKIKLGLKLNELYEFRGDIPENSEEILKYNNTLTKKSSIYTLEEIMEIIYITGDIKSDEYVIIFDNSCRGLKNKSPLSPPPVLIVINL